MKRETAFRALNARRANERNAKMKFVVKSVNKDGSTSRAPMTETDWRFNAFEWHHDAEKRASALEALNPGKQFTVVPL